MSSHAYIVVVDLESNSSWFVDNSATQHMTIDSNNLDIYDHYFDTKQEVQRDITLR
ncbi:hypothetical protein AAG906_004950 [Vitis piasezkii]